MIDHFNRAGGVIINNDISISLQESKIRYDSGVLSYDELHIASDHIAFLDSDEFFTLDRPCFFHYYKLASSIKNKHYYYVNYAADMLHTRATNYHNYFTPVAGGTSKVICIEQPVHSVSHSKDESSRFSNKVLEEYEEVLGEKILVTEKKTVFTPKTLPLWKPNSLFKIASKLNAVSDEFPNIKVLPIQASQRSDALRYCLNLDK